MRKKKKQCYFIENDIKHVDFRDVHLLNRFIDSHGKVLARKRTGLSAQFQRKVERSIKQARYMALLPYVRR